MDWTCLCMNVWNLCAGYMWYECLWNISICHIYFLCKLWDFIKNRKKKPNMQALCRLPPTATGSLPSAADGKEATWHPAVLSGSWPIWSVCLQWQTAKSKNFCRQRRTAKACHVVTCRWHHKADGKDTRKFAVCSARQRPAVSHLTDWRHNYCRPPSLPSAADGKGPLPSAARK